MTSTAPTDDPRWSRPDHRPGEDHQVPVRVADGVLLVVWSLVGQVLVVVGVRAAGVDVTAGAGLVALQLLAQSVVLAGTLAWFAGRGRLGWRLTGSVPPTVRAAAIGVATGALGVLLVAGIVLAASAVTEVTPADQQLVAEALGGGLATVLAVLAAVVLAPVVEELVFRGVLFQALGRRIGHVPGAVVAGLVFALVHLELTEVTYFVALTALGTLFALAFHRHRSLLVPVVAHATFNGVQLALALGLRSA